MAHCAFRMAFGALASLLFHGAQASLLHLTFNAERAKNSNRPVSKVTTLLKDMLAELEKEAAADKETYDKLACWCTTGDAEKTEAIATAEANIKSLQKEIEKLTASIAKLTAEIESTEEEVAKNEAALAKATELREKELAAFKEEEAFLLESISALTGAIDVLSKHHGGKESFLQLPVASELRNALQRVLTGGGRGVSGPALSASQQRILMAAMQTDRSGQPVAVDSYNAASGEIFGVLTQMKETFEKDLADAQAEEQKSQEAFEQLKVAKEAEIAAGKAQIEAKKTEKADAEEALANAKIDLDNTEKSLAADQEFLAMLKEKCSLTDKEFEERTTVRQEEMGAVSKALAVLSGDSAQDLFSRSLGSASAAASFLQSGSRASSKKRSDVSQLLSNVARRFRNPRLAQLAVRVRLDAFTKVKKAIDDMITELQKEKEAEIKHKDFCVDELNQNQLQTEEKTREREDLLSKIEELKMTIERLTEEIDTLKAEVGDLQLQLKRAGEDREAESREFQQTVADQRATQKLLEAALTVLQGFYGKSLLQVRSQQEPVGPPPPPGFKAYEKSAMSGGVMAEITQIMEDAAAMEKEAIKCEVDAQDTYKAFVDATNASIEAKAKEIVSLTEEKAKTEGELSETEQAKEYAESELEQLKNYNAELHTSCDYILKNFDVRQSARDEEVAALKQAKAILSGANFGLFLQKGQ